MSFYIGVTKDTWERIVVGTIEYEEKTKLIEKEKLDYVKLSRKFVKIINSMIVDSHYCNIECLTDEYSVFERDGELYYLDNSEFMKKNNQYVDFVSGKLFGIKYGAFEKAGSVPEYIVLKSKGEDPNYIVLENIDEFLRNDLKRLVSYFKYIENIHFVGPDSRILRVMSSYIKGKIIKYVPKKYLHSCFLFDLVLKGHFKCQSIDECERLDFSKSYIQVSNLRLFLSIDSIKKYVEGLPKYDNKEEYIQYEKENGSIYDIFKKIINDMNLQ